ncbi:CBS domain-containing protein [Companilactobacillus kedongensis]|uniref:CBS domain-containing protein n=1 Tax=Companilactobacillus kedongensis TaxID=2486004 RepID=UPI000F782BBB|nr:helix-turn-helix transcriptional regulator [Companilactobacillus kedongensis]
MYLTKRQKQIIELTKEQSPMTSEQIAERLDVHVPTIRGDLRLLTAVEILKSRPKVGYEFSQMPKSSLNFEELYDSSIANILKKPTFVQANTTLQECVNILFLKDSGSLYVVDDDKNLLGLISRKDLLSVTVNNADTDSMVASMVMTRMPNLITVTSDMTIIEVGKLLFQHEVDSLPVTEKDDPKQVVGKITKNRIFQYFVELGLKYEN